MELDPGNNWQLNLDLKNETVTKTKEKMKKKSNFQEIRKNEMKYHRVRQVGMKINEY